jgi:hypothetical protein
VLLRHAQLAVRADHDEVLGDDGVRRGQIAALERREVCAHDVLAVHGKRMRSHRLWTPLWVTARAAVTPCGAMHEFPARCDLGVGERRDRA